MTYKQPNDHREDIRWFQRQDKGHAQRETKIKKDYSNKDSSPKLQLASMQVMVFNRFIYSDEWKQIESK